MMSKRFICFALLLFTGFCFSNSILAACIDTDGLNYNIKGSATDAYTRTDVCDPIWNDPLGKTLNEASCENGVGVFVKHSCERGCFDGACCTPSWQEGPWGVCVNGQQYRTVTNLSDCQTRAERPDNVQSCVSDTTNACIDSDSGQDFSTKGELRTVIGGNSDYCNYSDPLRKTLVEFYCENGEKKSLEHSCANGCENGACKANATSTCTTNWTPSAWSACDAVTKTRTRTYDNDNNCETPTSTKPQNQTQSCSVVCTPNWIPSAWSACDVATKTQTRTYTDSNDCGGKKTDEVKSCIMPCTDSDGGQNYFTKGTVNYDRSISYDHCYSGDSRYVVESFCNSDGKSELKYQLCSGGCFDGVCKKLEDCIPDWKPSAWSGCHNGIKTQTRTYTDANNCGGIKADEVKSCCTPDWKPKAWSACDAVTKTQTRTYTDVNVCGVITGKPNDQTISCSTTCTDSDGGKEYSVRGVLDSSILGSTSSHTDYCDKDPKYVAEFYCDSDGVGKAEWNLCPNGCENGACKTTTNPIICTPRYSSCTAWSACSGSQKTQTCTQYNCPSLSPTKTNAQPCTTTTTTTPASTCTDSDGGLLGGKVYYTPGYVTKGSSSIRSNDFCAGNYLAEQYCASDGKNYFVSFYCSNGCAGLPGACK